jgi:hypothetical protein
LFDAFSASVRLALSVGPDFAAPDLAVAGLVVEERVALFGDGIG